MAVSQAEIDGLGLVVRIWDWKDTAELAPTSAERHGPRQFARALIKAGGGNYHIFDDSDDEEPAFDDSSFEENMHRKNFISEVLDRHMDVNSKWQEMDLLGDPEARRKDRMSVTNIWADCNTPLHMAMHSESFRAATDLLLSRGADINIHNARGKTVLFQAVSDESVEKVKFLLERGADSNVPTLWANPTCRIDYQYTSPFVGQGGRLALQRAISIPSRELCTLLIDAGADVNLLLRDGWSFLDLAVLRRDKEIMRMLLEKGAKFSSFMSDKVHSNYTKGLQGPLDGINDIQRLARDLFASAGDSPPSQTRELFDLMVYSEEMTKVLNEDMDPRKKSTKLISAFHDSLSHLAGTVNPNRPPIPHCARCTEFQSLPESWQVHSTEQNWQWGNLEILLQSATSFGCPLCLLLVDVINRAAEYRSEIPELNHTVKLSGQRWFTVKSFTWMWVVRCGKLSGSINVDILSG